jgi:hypothetical protein
MNHHLEGKSYKFEDGISITVLQVKTRDEGVQWVHYATSDEKSLPKKLQMEVNEFVATYGHLFNVDQ